jgi:3-oxoacyl-[acyl-carrier protein] reductase
LARGVAVALARDGYRIAFSYRPGGTPPDATLEALRAYDGALAVPAELGPAGSALALFRSVERERGAPDVVIHGAGPIVVGPFARSTPEDDRAMIEGNFSSAVELTRAATPAMRERRFGRLVFFGMNGSHDTLPSRNMALYGAAKAAVVAFARTLALEEAAFGITVNVVEPGDIRDKYATRAVTHGRPAANPAGFPGSWEDIADVVRLVVRDEAGYLNGMVLGVNGGNVEGHEPPVSAQ